MGIKIGTAVFTYNRSFHTEKVLTALSNNSMLPEKLFLFHDGLKNDEDKSEWVNVQKILEAVDWTDTEIIVADTNKGLAKSIVDGINYVFESCDAVIVLEDDCVPSKGFMTYMCEALNKYESCHSVYNIGGYAWPIEVEKKEYDAYFNGRTSSWGWGTWKDRWQQYRQDNNLIDFLKNDPEDSERLAIWGNDLENMLIDRINGRNNSWAVYWSLLVLSKNGLCLSPYESLIDNIGFDGTGVHCGVSNEYEVIAEKEPKSSYQLPDELLLLDDVKEAFSKLHGGTTVFNHSTEKPHAIVYGMGANWVKCANKINERYYIEAFADKFRKGYCAGKKILSPEQLSDFTNDIIVITIQNPQVAAEIKSDLVNNYGLNISSIVIWQDE